MSNPLLLKYYHTSPFLLLPKIDCLLKHDTVGYKSLSFIVFMEATVVCDLMRLLSSLSERIYSD